jgi:hypothetical protein
MFHWYQPIPFIELIKIIHFHDYLNNYNLNILILFLVINVQLLC